MADAFRGRGQSWAGMGSCSTAPGSGMEFHGQAWDDRRFIKADRLDLPEIIGKTLSYAFVKTVSTSYRNRIPDAGN